MTEPVFVIHGIGNRDEAAFDQAVDTLATAVGGINARPVYWGDLGANYEWITQTVPGAQVPRMEVRCGDAQQSDTETLALFLLADSTVLGAEIRAPSAIPDLVLDAATDIMPAQAPESAEVRGGEQTAADTATVRAALTQNWPSTRWLPMVDDAELLRAIGAAVAGPIAERSTAPTTGTEVRSAEVRALDIGEFVRRRLNELDRVVGATIGVAAGRLNTHLRTALLPSITRAVGDILVYQRHREKIADRVRSVIAQVDPSLGRSWDNAVDVLAHSLGGVIAVDIATSDEPLWIRRLVTFGSQPSFFHICDPRGGALTTYTGTPIQLPESIGAWTNLWEPLDPLAFVTAHVFRLHDGSPPKDSKVSHLASSGIWTHSDYWTLDDVVRSIRQTLRSQ